jgi:flagellar basal body-associated protein FliL
MKRMTLVILISVITALFVAASGCTYTTGGQNGTQNATQNASPVHVRIPLLPRLFGNTTNSLVAISSRLSPAVCGLSVLP